MPFVSRRLGEYSSIANETTGFCETWRAVVVSGWVQT
jgi:hypothetical protein